MSYVTSGMVTSLQSKRSVVFHSRHFDPEGVSNGQRVCTIRPLIRNMVFD
jgi:hypothetical protein